MSHQEHHRPQGPNIPSSATARFGVKTMAASHCALSRLPEQRRPIAVLVCGCWQLAGPNVLRSQRTQPTNKARRCSPDGSACLHLVIRDGLTGMHRVGGWAFTPHAKQEHTLHTNHFSLNVSNRVATAVGVQLLAVGHRWRLAVTANSQTLTPGIGRCQWFAGTDVCSRC